VDGREAWIAGIGAFCGQNARMNAARAACAQALAVGARSYHQVDAILKRGLDRTPLPVQTSPIPVPAIPHEHLRGPEYYQ